MASYSISTTFGTKTDNIIFAKDYNAIEVYDSDAESYGVEVTVSVTFKTAIIWTGTFNGWVGGKTLTIDISAPMRAAARRTDNDPFNGDMFTIAVSGPIEWTADAYVLNGTSEVGYDGLLPPARIWYTPAEYANTEVMGIYFPFSPPYGLSISEWNLKNFYYRRVGTSTFTVGLGILSGTTEDGQGTYTLSDGSVRVCNVLDWTAWHPCEKPALLQWTGRNGVRKTWVWTEAGRTYESGDAVTVTAAENGVRRVSRQEESVTVVEKAADRDTRLYLADLAEADDAEMVKDELTKADGLWPLWRPVYVEEGADVDLTERLADIEMTVKFRSSGI